MRATTDPATVGETARAPFPDWTSPHRILAAVDGSPASAGALALAVTLAAHHRAELVVAHVVPAIDVLMPFTVDEPGISVPHQASPHDHEVLTDSAMMAQRRDVDVTAVLLAGGTAEAIVSYADANDVDVIVVGSRGHGAAMSALVGSVSLQVVRTSAKPVVVVHGARH